MLPVYNPRAPVCLLDYDGALHHENVRLGEKRPLHAVRPGRVHDVPARRSPRAVARAVPHGANCAEHALGANQTPSQGRKGAVLPAARTGDVSGRKGAFIENMTAVVEHWPDGVDTLVSKLREGLLRGFNVGLMCGIVEMDGAHASGKRASEKRGKPQSYRKGDEQEAQEDALLTDAGRKKAKRNEKQERREREEAAIAAGGRRHPANGGVFPEARRVAFTCRRKGAQKGKGSTMTRVGVGLAETPEVAQAMADDLAGLGERTSCWPLLRQRRCGGPRAGIRSRRWWWAASCP